VSHDTWFLLGLFSGTAVCGGVYGIAASIERWASRRRAARQSLAVINRRRETAYARLYSVLQAGGNDQRYLDELAAARDACLVCDAEAEADR
jgi:hypothetical protein